MLYDLRWEIFVMNDVDSWVTENQMNWNSWCDKIMEKYCIKKSEHDDWWRKEWVLLGSWENVSETFIKNYLLIMLGSEI